MAKPQRRGGSGSVARMPLEGVVRDVTQAGASVVETSEGVVFVHGGLPGEQVRVRVNERRQGVLWGELEAVLAASAERVEPPCSLASRCGGCPLMAASANAQHALKLEHVARAVHELCLEGVVPQLEAAGPLLGYRRRVRLAFRKVGGRNLLGYRAHQSQHIVDAERCLVLEPALQKALDAVRSTLLPALGGASGELELAKLDPDGVVVNVACDAPLAPDTYRIAESLVASGSVRGVSLRVQKGAPATFGESEQSSVARDGGVLRAPATGFAQANAGVNARLVELVAELAQSRDARVLELYSGHGNLTVALAPGAAQLDAYELDAAAAEACRANLRARGLVEHVRVHTADAAELPASKRGARAVDAIVLDPPRAGAPGLASLVQREQPARVVYVSCHMTTLGRDLRALAQLGYRADRVHALDMFPQTAHVEAVVRMVRTH